VERRGVVEQPMGDPGDELDVAPVLPPSTDEPIDREPSELVRGRGRSVRETECVEHHPFAQAPLGVDEPFRAEGRRGGRQDPAAGRQELGPAFVNPGNAEAFGE
jgi:hypothetical protein